MSAVPIFAYSPSNSKLTKNERCDMNHCILELAVTPWLSQGAILFSRHLKPVDQATLD